MPITISAIFRWTMPILALGFMVPAVWAADFPRSAELQYVGPYGVPATMTFSRSGGAYKVVASINVPLYQMRFESSGTMSAQTLQPLSYTDTRKGKVYAQASFSGKTVRYGKSGTVSQTAAVRGPTFDLFTLAWQLALNNGQLPQGLHITNGKKLYPVSGIRYIGREQYRIDGGDTTINRYRVQRGDDTIDYAFAPEFYNIPAQITYVDGGKTHTLKLKSIKINGQIVQPK